MNWLRRLLRPAPDLPAGLHVAKLPAGGVVIMDDEVKRGLASPGPAPTQAALDALLCRATRVRVREPIPSDGQACRVFLETERQTDLDALREALRIHDGGIGHCMCFGTVEFELFEGTGLVAQISLHHGVSIRLAPLFYNAALVSPGPILEWLAERGVTFPLEEFKRDQQRRAEYEKAAVRWHEAMPDCLKMHWGEMRQGLDCRDEYVEIVERTYPNPVERARVLLEWYGKGQGPWSGFPAYEQVPERILLRIPLDSLLAAREPVQNDAMIKGTARLFGGWSFFQARPEELKRLPLELKRQLLEHSLLSTDDDQRGRARAAFS